MTGIERLLPDGVEHWLPVVGYEGLYEVSDYGRVRSLVWNGRWGLRERKAPLIRKAFPNRDGYHIVVLFRDKVRQDGRVHVMVLEAFRGPAPPGHWGLHNDGDPDNNALTNLRWGTPAENSADRDHHGRTTRGSEHHFAKLTPQAVREIRASTETLEVLAARYGVNHTAVSFARRGVTWKHVQ